MALVYPTVKSTTSLGDVQSLCSLVLNAVLILATGGVTNRKEIGKILNKLTEVDAALLTNQNVLYMRKKYFCYLK